MKKTLPALVFAAGLIAVPNVALAHGDDHPGRGRGHEKHASKHAHKHGHGHDRHKHSHDKHKHKWFDRWHDDDEDEQPTPPPTDVETPPADDTTAQDVLDGINEYRTEQGLSTLTMRADVTANAQLAADSIAAGAEREGWISNIDGESSAELIGTGESADAIVDAWIADSNYSFDLAKPQFTHAGIGVAEIDGTFTVVAQLAEYAEDTTDTGDVVTDPVLDTGDESTTGGDGGAFDNVLDEEFTSNGITSNYHRFAEGIDPTQPIGVILYGDGSGGSGFDYPNSEYLLDADGESGLVAAARERNFILVVPEAPSPSCGTPVAYDNCWYNSSGTPSAADKAAWASDLLTQIKSEYDIAEDRIVVGGYSSGAQMTTRWFAPNHGEEQSVDLFVPISYGGEPADTDAVFSDEYKQNTVLVFNTGTADDAYGFASYEARAGEQWYREAGFTTEPQWIDGLGHNRDDFDDVVAAAIDKHLLGV